MHFKTHKQIAEVLELPQTVIDRSVAELTEGTDTVTHQMKIKLVKKDRPVKIVISKTVMPEKKQDQAAIKYHADRKKEYDRKKFTTKDVDYKQMISVRVDEKTTIFIKPGESAVEARMNYLDREKIKKKKLYAKPDHREHYPRRKA